MSRLVTLRFICLFVLLAASTASAEDVRIRVLGLFHPSQLTVSSAAGSVVIVHVDLQNFTLDSSSAISRASIRARGNELVINYGARSLNAREVTFAGRAAGPVDFVLSIPGKISRHYRGRLEISNVSGELVPVVIMDLETAVASAVAAESLPAEPIEGLKAQAVATRSYFVAGKGRHDNFDFCDTTHCQFLRSPPPTESAAFKATAATRDLVLSFESQVFAAMYTRSCSGRTHTPAELGLPPGRYPFYSVGCPYCREHPARWHTRIAAAGAANLIPLNEPSRLKAVRVLGWSTVPSNDFTMKKEGAQIRLDGVGQGHGIGLCQAGANDMAEHGANFRQILAHFYPNTTLTEATRAADPSRVLSP